ncbi:MAG: DUF2007 domain-containing protein [Pseudomonadota bacterium]
MIELMRTNDNVLLNFVEVLLRDAGIAVIIADQNMSVLEGSLGVLPRRVLVDRDNFDAAKQVLQDADLGQWIKHDTHPLG